MSAITRIQPWLVSLVDQDLLCQLRLIWSSQSP